MTTFDLSFIQNSELLTNVLRYLNENKTLVKIESYKEEVDYHSMMPSRESILTMTKAHKTLFEYLPRKRFDHTISSYLVASRYKESILNGYRQKLDAAEWDKAKEETLELVKQGFNLEKGLF